MPDLISMQVQRPKKIIAKPNTPLITEKELLNIVPSSISYSTRTHYDFFNHGKSRIPSKVLHWTNFIGMVKNHLIDDVLKKYEKPSVPFYHSPISTKGDLIQVIDIQIIRPLTSKLNHDDLELCKASENLLVDWKVVNNSNQVISSIASRTHRVLRTKKDDDAIEAYKQNIGDFADNINEVYDYMCELGLKYSVLTTYEFTWFLKRCDNDPSVLLISKCQQNDSNNPTILQSLNYLLYLSKNESLLTACPTFLPFNNNLQNTRYFINYTSARYLHSSINPAESSTTVYKKHASSSDEEKDHEVKKFRHNESITTFSNYFKSYGIINWNSIVIKNKICDDIYLAEYDGEQLALKNTQGTDWRKVNLEKEAQIYERLSSIQGVYIPRMRYNGFTLKGEKYIFATEYIKQTSKLTQKYKEDALKAIKAIHSLGIIHNDIRECNFIVGYSNDNDNSDEHVFIINFCLSKDFKEEHDVRLASYHIYMEKEKEKIEDLFSQLSN